MRPASEMVWCGARKGRVATRAWPEGQDAGDRMDLGGGERFLQGWRWENRGQAAGEHGLARARRPDHEQIVPSAGGDFEGALGVILAAHVRKVNPVVGVAAKYFLHVQFVGPLARVTGQNG